MAGFDIFENIFGSILGGISKFTGVARLLGMIGGVLKSFDSNDRGIDDAAGEVCIGIGRIFEAIEDTETDRDRVQRSIDSARVALDVLEKVYENNNVPTNPGPTGRVAFVDNVNSAEPANGVAFTEPEPETETAAEPKTETASGVA